MAGVSQFHRRAYNIIVSCKLLPIINNVCHKIEITPNYGIKQTLPNAIQVVSPGQSIVNKCINMYTKGML